MRNLPPLNAIKAFEAAARHVSFSKAASELEVTHGAISKQIAILEQWLSTPLFLRNKSQISLSKSGQELFEAVSPALDRIALGVLNVIDQNELENFRISAPPTFTLRWLIPRLSTFQKKMEHVEFLLSSSIEPIDFEMNQYDVAIRGADSPSANFVSVPFMTETIVPICHPDILEKIEFNSYQDLHSHTLIHYDTEPVSWKDWLKSENTLKIQCHHLHFEQMYFALQAASEGLGIVLVPLFLVADEVISGKLVLPFGLKGARTRRYYLNAPLQVPANPLVENFISWLTKEGNDTEKAINVLCEQMGFK